jgi:large subunit ribosomal protein L9
MQVILLERVESLGAIGDEVKVRDGFARNFLLPQKKALRATDANRKVFEGRRAELEARNAEAKAAAEKASGKIDGTSYVLIRQAGEAGQLYGSVSSRDVADEILKAGAKIDRNAVVLDKPIKTIGVYDVRVRLHAEVYATVKVNVARSADEAERQARVKTSSRRLSKPIAPTPKPPPRNWPPTRSPTIRAPAPNKAFAPKS